MFSRLGRLLSNLSGRFMPDPFIFALVLSLVTVALALLLTEFNLGEITKIWGGLEWGARQTPWKRGFWGFLEFSMQMCLILVSGHVIASAPLVKRLIDKLALIPKTTQGAVLLISFFAMLGGLINWGLGLIVGAFLAREVYRSGHARGIPLDYPILAAAGYSGLLIWHGGLSGSAPLDIASGILIAGKEVSTPISKTLLSPLNITLSCVLLAGVPLLFYLISSKKGEVENLILPRQIEDPKEGKRTFASILENSPLFTIIFAGGALFVIIEGITERGIYYFDLYSVPFIFLFMGMVLHLRPISFVNAISEGAKSCGGIILQFPFYAGISAIMAGTGLGELISGKFTQIAIDLAEMGISIDISFPVLSFLSAGFINMFIPSGGGQWKVQGPIILEAGRELGIPLEKGVMSIAYGDELTNMLQPFWAIALLGITGLKARDIMGYTTCVMIFTFPLYILLLCIF
jgi:short-chain fatty acids transporter